MEQTGREQEYDEVRKIASFICLEAEASPDPDFRTVNVL